MPDNDPASGGGFSAGGFSEEQQAAIGSIVNSAITNHLKRSLGPQIAEALKATKWDEMLGPSVTGLIDKYLEDLPDPDAAPEDDQADPKSGKRPGKRGADSAVEQQLQKLATDLENERKARSAAEQATKEAEQKRLMESANTAFRNALQPKLRADLLDVAVGHFGHALKVAEDGSPLLRVKRAPYKGAPEVDDDVALAEALPILLASESMKPFLPAPGADGTPRKGGSPSVGGSGATALDSKDPADRVAARLAAMGIDFNSEFSG